MTFEALDPVRLPPTTRPMQHCEVCRAVVFTTWFAIVGDRRTKCGRCSKPPRADTQHVFADHDAGDEDRTQRDD